jgi:OmpA-OmpF porin, OOP family
MTMGKSFFVASLGLVVAGASVSCGSSQAPAASPAGKTASTTDSDDDGIFDDVDLCPNDKEDGKPPNDKDGCPVGKGKS